MFADEVIFRVRPKITNEDWRPSPRSGIRASCLGCDWVSQIAEVKRHGGIEWLHVDSDDP